MAIQSPCSNVLYADDFQAMSFTGGIQEAVNMLPAPTNGIAGIVICCPRTYDNTKTVWLHPGVVLHMNGALIRRATGSISNGDPNISGAVIAAGPRGSDGTEFSSGNRGENIYIIGPGVIDGNQSITSLTNVNLTPNGFRCR